MKKILTSGVILLVGLSAALYLLGLSPTNLRANAEVGTGMGAKLGCSARYLTGMDEAQIASDLASYTPATQILSVTNDDANKRVSVDLFGFAGTSASYRPGLGCTLDIGDTTPLDRLEVPQINPGVGLWPDGGQAPQAEPAVQAQLQQILAVDNAAGQDTRALLVIHAGELVAEAYADGYGADTLLLGWSMGKSLTAIALGQLEAQGRLRVDEANLFPQWQADERKQITLEQLMHMSSGLDFSEVYAPGSDATKMLFTAYSASDIALASPLGRQPDTHFYYSSGTTNILMRFMHERLGGTQASVNYLYQDVLAPLGMAHTVVELDGSGVFVGSSYVYASARDWARLGQLMLNEGTLNGHRLLTADWVKRAQTPNLSNNDPRYGYQFWLNNAGAESRWPELPEDAYAMSGNRAQTVMIIPSRDVVLVRLGWSSGSYPMAENFAALLEVIGAT